MDLPCATGWEITVSRSRPRPTCQALLLSIIKIHLNNSVLKETTIVGSQDRVAVVVLTAMLVAAIAWHCSWMRGYCSVYRVKDNRSCLTFQVFCIRMNIYIIYIYIIYIYIYIYIYLNPWIHSRFWKHRERHKVFRVATFPFDFLRLGWPLHSVLSVIYLSPHAHCNFFYPRSPLLFVPFLSSFVFASGTCYSSIIILIYPVYCLRCHTISYFSRHPPPSFASPSCLSLPIL